MQIIYIVLGVILGGIAGYEVRKALVTKKTKEAESIAQNILDKAQREQKEILLDAKDEALKVIAKAKEEENKRREQLSEVEKNILKKEELITKKDTSIEEKRSELTKREETLKKTQETLDKSLKESELKIEKIAKLTREQAKEELFARIEEEYSHDVAQKIRDIEQRAKTEGEKKARDIIVSIIDRYAADFTAEFTVMSVQIPSEDMKGRIIGKEGRNIQAFEKATGVDLIIDDTPDAVVISSFDSVRRHTAKRALEKLIHDGRIHPARIEETVEKVKKEIAQSIQEAGENAIHDLGVTGIHPDLVKILGRLKYRTSYGQNQLDHAVEVATIAGMLAKEVNADVAFSKKAALFHDIGKAISQEVGGSHVDLGSDIVKKYGFNDDLINAMESHHEDVEPTTIEAVLVKAADAISAARPGARRESFENYIKRLTEIEGIANSFEGVDKSYAIQAGREIRIIVKPGEVDDLKAIKLAKNVASRLEKEMVYPGEIKVHVIRETRTVEYAR